MDSPTPPPLPEHWKMPHRDQPGHVMTLSEAQVTTPRAAAPKVLRKPRETTQHTLGRSAWHFPVFREPRWRRKVHVMAYALGVWSRACLVPELGRLWVLYCDIDSCRKRWDLGPLSDLDSYRSRLETARGCRLVRGLGLDRGRGLDHGRRQL